MKKFTLRHFLFAAIMSVFFFSGKVHAQSGSSYQCFICGDLTWIYYQSFDSTYTYGIHDWPTGWEKQGQGYTGPGSITDSIGWYDDISNGGGADGSGNSNPDYQGSGDGNMVCKNRNFTGEYDLLTPIFSTLDFDSIQITYGARMSANFPATGSSLAFFGSFDGGQNWNQIYYSENNNNSIWSVINNDAPIVLPPSYSRQPAIRFKWAVDIINGPKGTYRLEDFTLLGHQVAGSGVNDLSGSPYAQVTLINNSFIKVAATNSGSEKLTVEVINLLGQSFIKQDMNTATFAIPVTGLSSGLYLVRVSNGTGSQITKIVLDK